MFDFFTNTIKKTSSKDVKIEALKTSLLHDSEMLQLIDLGAGSRISKNASRSVSSITKHASTPSKFSRFLLRLIEKYDCTEVVELGTSLGLNTLYISKASKVNITTLEGDPTIAQKAQGHFNEFNRTNIKVVVGNIDKTLQNVINSYQSIDLAYIDANHRYEPTLRYFEALLTKTHERSIIVIDDIHWSKQMAQAWKEIKTHRKVSVSVDIFDAGILFFDPKLEKEDYVLSF